MLEPTTMYAVLTLRRTRSSTRVFACPEDCLPHPATSHQPHRPDWSGLLFPGRLTCSEAWAICICPHWFLGIVWPLATRRLLPYYNWEPDLYFSVILGCVRLFFCWRQSSCLTPSVCMCIVQCHKHIQPEGDVGHPQNFRMNDDWIEGTGLNELDDSLLKPELEFTQPSLEVTVLYYMGVSLAACP
jgi:hypothetical protein